MQVLDFYHLAEQVHRAATIGFADEAKAHEWTETILELLLAAEIAAVFDYLQRSGACCVRGKSWDHCWAERPKVA